MRENADRFEGLAETYALYRPGYPIEVFADLLEHAPQGPRLAVDVGAGPGNSTRALRAALPDAWLLLACEPGRDMRRVLVRDFANNPKVQVVDACAERLPLHDGSASMIVACTAFHWFDRSRFFAEAARTLVPQGVLALVRNHRAAHPLVTALDAYIAAGSLHIPDFRKRERGKEPSIRELGAETAFMAARSRKYTWSLTLDRRGVIDLYLTRSTVWEVVRRIGLQQVMADLTGICEAHFSGTVDLPCITTVKSVIRRPQPARTRTRSTPDPARRDG